MRSSVASLALVSVAAPFGLGLTSGLMSRSDDDRGGEVLRFADPELVESSGLVVDGDRFLTVNDSGDTARVFAVAGDGSTAAVTSWAAEVRDVEAVAPAGDGAVWVGDIGDNRASRRDVTLWRVPLVAGEVEATPYRMGYPDGARDAETLLTEPSTGRLYVVSKVVFGGGVYAAPADLRADRVNRLERVGSVTALVTDGAFFPDGRHLVLRSYTRAFVHAWPSLDPVGDFSLPEQEQGEGIAVGADDRLYLSSEGRHAPLLEVELPGRLRTAMAPPEPSESPSSGPADSEEPEAVGVEGDPDAGGDVGGEVVDAGHTGWIIGGLMFLVALAFGVRALRPR